MKERLKQLVHELENIPCDIDGLINELNNSLDRDDFGDELFTPENVKTEKLIEALDQVNIYWSNDLTPAIAEFLG